MGMTDKQFQSWVRLIMDDLKDMDNETDIVKIKEKLAKLMDNLQKTLED